MPHVDSLLSLVHREGANELRIGTDRAPSMFANGAPKRLSIPKTSPDTLRHLMGDLMSSDVVETLEREGQVETQHVVPSIGAFQVRITKRAAAGEIDVVFFKGPPGSGPGPADAPAAGGPPLAPVVALAPAPASPPVASVAPMPRPLAPAGPVALSKELSDLIARALALGASDVHLASGEPPVVRVHGTLQVLRDGGSYRTTGAGEADSAALIGSILDDRSRALVEGGASVDLGAVLHGSQGDGPSTRARINVFRTSTGIAAAIRILPRTIPALADLGFSVPIDDLATLPNGLVIVSGPTGCGKSTTLASLVAKALQDRSIALVTLEDPIEYAFSGTSVSVVRQRQVGRDVRDFATGLRDALREDPDVILVGEMRDPESISLALTAAETGHLVLTTLHSRSAAAAVERIVDACPESARGSIRVQLADSLRAVVSQRLVPHARGEGRVLACEVLRVNTGVASSIREAKISGVVSAMQSGRKDGMITLERSLADLVKRHEITMEVARSTANDRQAFASYMAGA
jgi:twitching motility protein PilT